MLRRHCVVWLIILIAAPALHAQTPPSGIPDPTALEAMRQMAQRMMNPVAFALEHRAELQLTEAQLAVLEPASAQLSELQGTTMRRTQELARQMSPGMSDPQAPLDPEAIRKAYHDRAELDADLAIRMLEARRWIAQVLDAEQHVRLQQLQRTAVLELMRNLPGLPPR